MQINPQFKDVPHIKEKIEALKKQIATGQRTVANWQKSEPTYYLLQAAKNQLELDIKMLNCITGASPC